MTVTMDDRDPVRRMDPNLTDITVPWRRSPLPAVRAALTWPKAGDSFHVYQRSDFFRADFGSRPGEDIELGAGDLVGRGYGGPEGGLIGWGQPGDADYPLDLVEMVETNPELDDLQDWSLALEWTGRQLLYDPS